MAKVISEKEQASDNSKMVEIKHTRTMEDASGNSVEVVDYIETQVDEAICRSRSKKSKS